MKKIILTLATLGLFSQGLVAQSHTFKTTSDFAYSSPEVKPGPVYYTEPFFALPDTSELAANSTWIGEYRLNFRVYANTWEKLALSTLYYHIAYKFGYSGCQTSFTYPSGANLWCKFEYFNIKDFLDTNIAYWKYPPGEDAIYRVLIQTDSLREVTAAANYTTGTSSAARTSEFFRWFNHQRDTSNAQLVISFRLSIGANPGHLRLKWAAMPFVSGDWHSGTTSKWTQLKKGSMMWIRRVS